MSEPIDPEVTRPALMPTDEPPPRRWRRRRVLGCGGLALLVLLLLAAIFVAWMVTSRAGARFVFARVSALVPGILKVEGMEGPVRGPLVLHNLHYETERFIVDIAEVRLVWHPWRLRRRAIDVDELAARGVRVKILPSEVVAERKLTDIDFRYNVIVRALRVDDVQIEQPGGGRPIVVDRLTMKTGDWGDRVRIEDVDVISADVDLDARGWLRPKGDYPLDVQVVWAYRPPEKRAPLSGRGRLFGTLRALRLDQRLE